MSDLDRLAQHYGVEPHYFDIWGNRHDISTETKSAILRALGVRTGSDAEIADELRAVERRSWQRPLPPVLVASTDRELEVELSIPTAWRNIAFHWRIRTEQSSEHQGSFSPSEFPTLDTRDLDGCAYQRVALALPGLAEPGYHRLELMADETFSTLLIVCPDRCFSVTEAAGDERIWGLALQLYSLRSDSNWGIGDLSDLARFAETAAGFGASLVGVNPLHSLFPAEPRHCSPYSPSSREFLNPLYIAVDQVPDLAGCAAARGIMADTGFQRRKEEARQSGLVDYAAVSEMKRASLEAAYRCFRQRELDGYAETPRGRAFRAFQRDSGPALRRHALFETLHERFLDAGTGVWSWRDWPEPFRDCDSAEVRAFERANLARVEFFEYLQWQADKQLANAQRGAVQSGMSLGLYCDLAVAVHPDGSSAWSYPGVLIADASVGAPPDDLGPDGQNWGLSPLSPVGLQETGYAPFIAALRANMRHAGAIRIDHVMGLQRLFWIPRGMKGTEGAYVRYPLQDLLRIIALESQRNRCIVVGEDLGTVAAGFRETLAAVGILSYKVLLFEREADGRFRKPDEYPEGALVTASTHDLPTIAGFRAGRDIEWRRQLGSFADDAASGAAWSDRGRTVQMLDSALSEHVANTAEPSARENLYLASTPARILMLQMEDLLGELEQPNLPGTFEEHPNWRRKLSQPLKEIFQSTATRSLLKAVARARAHEARRH